MGKIVIKDMTVVKFKKEKNGMVLLFIISSS